MSNADLVERLRGKGAWTVKPGVTSLPTFGTFTTSHGPSIFEEAAARIAALEEREKALMEAVEPFVKVAAEFDERESNGYHVHYDSHIKPIKDAMLLINFRRARTVHEAKG